MRRWLLSCLILFVAPLTARAQSLTVGVDPRVELMAIVFRLAGATEFVNNDLVGYAAAVDAHFAPFAGHEVVQVARELRRTHGIGFDKVMGMAAHLTLGEHVTLRGALEGPTRTLDARWPTAGAQRFVAALDRFVTEARFREFLAAQRGYHDSASARLSALVARRVAPDWFDRFFGVRGSERFILVPGLLNGGGSFGPRVSPGDGPDELWAILGTWASDSSGIPLFPDGHAFTIAHEFAHSYVNPMVAKHLALFEPFAAGCPQLEAAMRAQSYVCWKTIVDESIVRATSLAWARAHGTPHEARMRQGEEEGRAFVWTGELADSLEAWHRARGPEVSWERDIPRLAAWFAGLGPRIPALQAAFNARRPNVVRTSIANGATGVATGEVVLEVTFDRPMVRGWSITRLEGVAADEAPPAMRAPSISPDSLTFRVTMTLEAGKAYAFALNGPLGGGFRSSDGVPLAATPIRFQTGSSAD
ncbi:MAG TPA: DUF4932 domain-containing protein [Gemmatimonadales bacterium]|nr:DUF4932 domain-containing protein [Gemmatimonadales bacterium]